MFGRDREIAAALHYLSTPGDACRLVLVGGNAGIGKTRFVREIANLLSDRGWRVLEGACFESTASQPFAPFVDILRSCFPEGPEGFVSAHGSIAGMLVPLVPEWGGGDAADPQRIYLAFGALIDSMVAPVLIVIEDLHWCDESSLALVEYLNRRSAPGAIIVTYRDDQLSSALRHFLAESDRLRRSYDLLLRPIDRASQFALLRSLGAESLASAARDRVLELADGNPFYLEELVKSAGSAGSAGWVPRSVEDAIARRMATLDVTTQRVAVVAAVAGWSVDPVIVRAVAGVDEDVLVDHLDSLVRANILVDDVRGLFFRHALTREAVYSSVYSLERRRLHRSVALAIEREYAPVIDRYLVELANHWYLAHDWNRTLDLAQRIGDRALRLGTSRAAFDCFSRAFEAAKQLGRTPPARLNRSRGQAAEILGLFETAEGDFQKALSIAREEKDSVLEWQCLLDLGYLWSSRDYTRTGDYFAAALRLAREIGDNGILTRSLNRMGNWHLNSGDPTSSHMLHQEALDLAEDAGNAEILAETLDLFAMASAESADLDGLLRYGRRAADLFRQQHNLQGLSSILATLSGTRAHPEGETLPSGAISAEDSRRMVDEALAVAREIDWQAGETYALMTRGNGAMMNGRYQAALTDLSLALEIATSIGHLQWEAATELSIGWAHGLFLSQHAEAHLERAVLLAKRVGSTIFSLHAVSALAHVAIERKQLVRAIDLLEGVQPPMVDPLVMGPMLAERSLWRARADLALAQGNAALALRIVDAMLALIPGTNRTIPRLDRLRGDALLSLRRWDEAEEALFVAIAEAQRIEVPSEVWRAWLSLGRLFAARGQIDRANEAYDAARRVIDGLVSEVPVDFRDAFVRGAAALFPPRPVLTLRRQAKQTYDGLTQRECDVATLVAKGKTNREIAGDLVLSERTVSTHVTNILSKLGFRSRAQIATWVAAKGLT